MTKRLVDIDDEILDRAREALGTVTLKDTVNAALDEARRAADRRRLTREDLQEFGHLVRDLGDPEVMARAWK